MMKRKTTCILLLLVVCVLIAIGVLIAVCTTGHDGGKENNAVPQTSDVTIQTEVTTTAYGSGLAVGEDDGGDYGGFIPAKH